MMSSTQQPPAAAGRPGVTLVELLVAMTLLTVGLLAIVGVSGSVSRSLGESRSDNLAAVAAQSRFERLAGTSCTTLTLNAWTTAASRNITEKYRVLDMGNNIRSITDSVSWITRKGTRRQTFTTLLPCRPGA